MTQIKNLLLIEVPRQYRNFIVNTYSSRHGSFITDVDKKWKLELPFAEYEIEGFITPRGRENFALRIIKKL